MVVIGILLATVATVVSVILFARSYERRELAASADRLVAAQDALRDDDLASALSLAGEAFWSAPSGVYEPEDARRVRDILVVVQTALHPSSQPTADSLEPVIRSFEMAKEKGTSVPPELLRPVAEFLDDVAGDTYLAGQILENLDSGTLQLDLGTYASD